MVDKNVKFISKDRIIEVVTGHFDVSLEDMASQSRKRSVCYPRQVLTYFLVKYTQLSLEALGNILGGRDHTTVMHASETIRDLMDVYENVIVEVKEISQKLYE
jgi:chromosomal replication initiator protein